MSRSGGGPGRPGAPGSGRRSAPVSAAAQPGALGSRGLALSWPGHKVTTAASALIRRSRLQRDLVISLQRWRGRRQGALDHFRGAPMRRAAAPRAAFLIGPAPAEASDGIADACTARTAGRCSPYSAHRTVDLS